MNDGMIEVLSAILHVAWMNSKRQAGYTSRVSETGEELMVPYFDLSNPAKELDRETAKSVLATMDMLGYKFTPK